MTSNKAIIASTMGMVGAAIVVSQMGLFGLSSFLGQGNVIDAVRLILLVMLSGLLIMKAPRAIAFRITLGVAAIMLVVGSIYFLGSYQLAFFDGLLFMTVATVLGFESLEIDHQPVSFGKTAQVQ